jgi:undecaprenyl diphosphate synthase
MDGNRRWANEQGREPSAGHEAGLKVFESAVMWLQEYGIPHGVFYAFSTENWQRSEAEVAFLLSLIETALARERTVTLRFIGDRTRFSDSLQANMTAAEVRSFNSTGVTVWIALSYGGRQEIVAAANEAVSRGELVTEATFSLLLQSSGMPDPDLIIRTGGDMRLSNFLPWQAVYSELLFTPTYWPAFTKDEFMSMLAQYGDRKRRFGR